GILWQQRRIGRNYPPDEQRQRAQTQHRAIAEAVAARDPEAARQAMLEHLASTRESLAQMQDALQSPVEGMVQRHSEWRRDNEGLGGWALQSPWLSPSSFYILNSPFSISPREERSPHILGLGRGEEGDHAGDAVGVAEGLPGLGDRLVRGAPGALGLGGDH